ncbi:TonB-dependent receptor [Lysobacteraceae bacterium NML71-0210]|nr:TonB-dependent receptor [Xanthomonadaceae bacterium NML71-0210]
MKLEHTAIALAIASVLTLPGIARADISAHASAEALAADNALIGQVKESGRGVSLEGAIISIAGRQAHTDASGHFRLYNLPAGNHTLRVDFLGYQSYLAQLHIEENGNHETVIVLHSNAQNADNLDAVVVRGQRDAQALALNQQRSSGNLVNVVSSDLLGQFPDNNIAESTQRIPGVSIERDQGEGRYVSVRGAPKEFTTVTIDGAQLANPNAGSRGVELDTIPSDVISSLEVTKALTPDMDGDAIAGNINIRTQSALDRDGITLRASLAAGQYQLGNGDNQRASASFGHRFGHSNNFGALISASWSKQGRFTDNVETVYFRDKSSGRILPEEVQIKDYEGTRTRTGINGRLDWRINQNHKLSLTASHAHFKDHEFRDSLVIGMDRHNSDATQNQGEVRATFNKELRERTYNKSIKTFNLNGEHWLGEWRANWQASRSVAEKIASPRRQYIFRSSVRPQMDYDYSNHDFPQWRILGRADAPTTGVNVPEQWFAFRRLNDRHEHSRESETGLRVDFTRAHEWFGSHGDIQFGLRARLRDKSFDDERYRNASATDFAALGISMSDMLCSNLGLSNNFDYFLIGRRFCRDIFQRHAPPLTQSSQHRRLLAESLTGDYRASEDVHAVYLRLDATWDRLSMIAGLRHEITHSAGEAVVFNTDTLESSPRQIKHTSRHFLPSLHLRYEFADNSILRAAYSTGINRPDFRHTAPYRASGELPSDPISEGNPSVKAAYAHNLDVLFEHYLQPLGLLSAGLFYKRIHHPLFVANSTENLPGGGMVRITRPENGSNGRVHGLELAWQQNFDQLPAPWNGFGIYGNYTWSKSSAELPFDGGKTELPGTSRHNYNLALSYEKYGINARLSWNRRSQYIQEFNIQDPDLTVYWGGRSSLDFSASYAFNKHLRLFVEANNITSSRQVRFQGERSRVLELEDFGRSWLIGLRYEY